VNNLRIFIVDDEPLAVDRLKQVLRAVAGAEVVGSACNGTAAIREICELEPDLVFLDMKMPGLSGVEVAAALKAQGQGSEIVFVTAFDCFASEAFDVDAADYLVKPVRLDRLESAVHRAIRRRDSRLASQRVEELELVVNALRDSQGKGRAKQKYDEELWAPRAGGLSRIPTSSVVWVEAARDYMLVHTEHRTHILRETMASLEARLDPDVFIRAHRSALVNVAHIVGTEKLGREGLQLRTTAGNLIRVGLGRRAAIRQRLGGRAGSAIKADLPS
jgi:two-component system LytT family response regulator/two-component system response regulator AlgR